jgi:hypothetical protein
MGNLRISIDIFGKDNYNIVLRKEIICDQQS